MSSLSSAGPLRSTSTLTATADGSPALRAQLHRRMRRGTFPHEGDSTVELVRARGAWQQVGCGEQEARSKDQSSLSVSLVSAGLSHAACIRARPSSPFGWFARSEPPEARR